MLLDGMCIHYVYRHYCVVSSYRVAMQSVLPQSTTCLLVHMACTSFYVVSTAPLRYTARPSPQHDTVIPLVSYSSLDLILCPFILS